MKGKFVEGIVKSVPANANEKALDVILPSALTDKYSVEKLSTAGLDTTYGSYQITWVNNFRLKPNSDKVKKGQKVSYEVQFEKPNVANLVIFIHDGSSVVMLDQSEYGDAGNGNVAVRLAGDDPAIGWGNG